MQYDTNINLDNIIIESIQKYKLQFASSAIIYVVGLFLSHIVFPNTFSKLINDITENNISTINYKNIMFPMIPYIISEILIYFSDVINTYYFPKIEFYILEKLSIQILESVKNNNKNINSTELILNLKKVFELKNIYHLVITYILPTILVSTALIICFLFANKKLGLLSIILLFSTFAILLNLSVSCTHKSVDNEKTINLYCDDINDIFLNINNVISAGAEKNEINRINFNGKHLHNKFLEKESCNSNLKFISAMMYFLVMLGLNLMSVNLFYQKIFDKTMLISNFIIVLNLVQHCDSMIYEMHNITHSIGKYKELREYFGNFKLKSTDLKNVIELPKKIKGSIFFKNVTIYNNSQIILKNINCTIMSSQKTAIIGNIGTGKTTLIKALLGFLKYKGSIFIDDINIKTIKHDLISATIAYIPQNPRLFNRTILENLSYGTNYSKDDIINILTSINIYEFFHQFQHGLDTNVGSNGDKLSGGQRQLVFILRSIIQNKKIFVLDEPTSSLDSKHKFILLNLLETQKDKTVIVITHDKEILYFFNQILLLENGNIKQIENYF